MGDTICRMIMLRLRNEAAEQIQEYVDSQRSFLDAAFYADKAVILWDVIERLLDILDEEQLEQIPKVLKGEEIL